MSTWDDYVHFVPKGWANCRIGGTDVSANALVDLEQRLSAYTDYVFGLPGVPGTQYVSENLEEEVLEDTGGTVSAATPDKVTFQLAQPRLVRINAQLNIWNPSPELGSRIDAFLYVNDALQVNERGNPVQGQMQAAAEVGAVLREDQPTIGTIIIESVLVAPFVDMATGLNLWLPTGTHTIELKYSCGIGDGHISQRLLVAEI